MTSAPIFSICPPACAYAQVRATTLSSRCCVLTHSARQCYNDRACTRGDLEVARQSLEALTTKLEGRRAADVVLLEEQQHKLKEQQLLIEHLQTENHLLEESKRRRESEVAALRNEVQHPPAPQR